MPARTSRSTRRLPTRPASRPTGSRVRRPSQHWMLAALDEATDAIVVVDRIGREIVRNAPARRFDGARHGEVLAQDAVDELLQPRSTVSPPSASSSSTGRRRRCSSCGRFPCDATARW